MYEIQKFREIHVFYSVVVQKYSPLFFPHVAIDNAIVANSQDYLLFSVLSCAASQQQVVPHKWPPDLLRFRMIRGSKLYSKRRLSYSRFVLSDFISMKVMLLPPPPCAAQLLMSGFFFSDSIQMKKTSRYGKTTTCLAWVFISNSFGTLLGAKWISKVMLYYWEICPVSLSVGGEGKKQ